MWTKSLRPISDSGILFDDLSGASRPRVIFKPLLLPLKMHFEFFQFEAAGLLKPGPRTGRPRLGRMRPAIPGTRDRVLYPSKGAAVEDG
jgi:hypothetical protein